MIEPKLWLLGILTAVNVGCLFGAFLMLRRAASLLDLILDTSEKYANLSKLERLNTLEAMKREVVEMQNAATLQQHRFDAERN